MIKINEIINSLEIVKYLGSELAEVRTVVPIEEVNSTKNPLSWCNKKKLDKLKEIANSSAVIIISDSLEEVDYKFNVIFVENPRRAFQKVLTDFFLEKRNPHIAVSAKISDKARIGQGAFIGNNVIIEEGCEIGNNVTILHNTVVLKNTIIGDDVTIGVNNTIGGTGFGYEKNKRGDFELIPHIGNVVIKNNVDIGNNTCIDRAVLGSTILENNVKVDNLVHIAHGVKVGRNSVIIANAMIAGSVNIGENSWIAPSSSIINKKNIGDNVLVGLGAVVTKNVENDVIVAGNPAKFIRKI
ncbi:UDP-3-O-(3-hydroxymyristoyl)glucosamine N-acyltransferase [Tenacibaculum maritimum]|uniref:UDP-3-O-(3-hydroxymyristoyl)glucosamine N-acyltransferase n=1 Tax=Tenacibaculum maritimum TaxID=107401 RepID=UPI0012E4E638|nr:UDP-3-O-(3-hydroxymyristoyl)glucosamine N-acyltransferase [Tenacibaculum maritimum]MCD9581675.1 UDP-3-O-(3-hydroxymyristoyl)glucosamine N-acyltransferase [Tenacibaculum maritimum]MCD9636199.1 UDP-3-O-(3-hydroxymyristoyl)glucosamine N-acyltransferase [Tenacibaculum maritimum]CAA0189725.1 conserved hypothetical protein [Tenacibaculum maritimum]CAA0191966.1 sugar acetyltransferase [Tenacibaculum maritimum]